MPVMSAVGTGDTSLQRLWASVLGACPIVAGAVRGVEAQAMGGLGRGLIDRCLAKCFFLRI